MFVLDGIRGTGIRGTRRINDEHRIVYKFQNDTILIAQLRYHYST